MKLFASDRPPTQRQIVLFVYIENKETLPLLSPTRARVITFIILAPTNTGSSLSRGKLAFPSPEFSPFSSPALALSASAHSARNLCLPLPYSPQRIRIRTLNSH